MDTMKRMQELVSAAKPAAVRRRLAGNQRNSGDPSPLSLQLFESLRSGNPTAEEAMADLYGAVDRRTEVRFRSLKVRLTHTLIETVIQEDVSKPDFSTYDTTYEHGHRQLEVARILMRKRLYASARELASQTYRRVKDFEIVTLNVGLTDILCSLNLGVAYNQRLFRKYHEQFVYYSETYARQCTLLSHYRLIRNEMYANRRAPIEIGQMALDFADQDKPIMEKYPTISLIQSSYINTRLTGLMLSGEYRRALKSAEEGIKTLEGCRGVNRTSFGLLALTKIDCTIKIRDFDQGLEQINAAHEWVPEGTINYLKIFEYAIRLGLITGNYEYSYLSLAEVQRKGLKHLLTPQHQEFWSVMEAYVHMLIIAGRIRTRPEWPQLKKFRLGKFLNEVPVNVRNKKGTNIQILVLQAVIYIIQGKFDQMIDRTGALSSYCNRYLRNDANLRNNGFFKLLTLLTKTNFCRGPAEERSRETLAKMRARSEQGELNDLELVPYETLWEVLLDHLD